MAERILPELLAGGALGVALFCGCRLALAVLRGAGSGLGGDAVHAAMGFSMAGMLTGWLTGAWNDLSMVVFACCAAWFGRAVARGLYGSSPAASTGWHLPHFVASAAMLFMLFAMGSSGMTSGMHIESGAGQLSLLDVVAALLFVGNGLLGAALTLASAAAEPLTLAGATSSPGHSTREGRAEATPERERCRERRTRRASAACVLVMSLAMAYMFLTVRP